MTIPDRILSCLYLGIYSVTLDLSILPYIPYQVHGSQMFMAHYPFELETLMVHRKKWSSFYFCCDGYLENGTPIDNSLQRYFTKNIIHPKYGEGRVLIGQDGLLVVLTFLLVDDVFIHAPILEKLETALDRILQTIFRLGLMYNPSKTSLFSQRVRY